MKTYETEVIEARAACTKGASAVVITTELLAKFGRERDQLRIELKRQYADPVGQGLRPGSRVSLVDVVGTIVGTVIAIKDDYDEDGDLRLISVTVRWDSGKIDCYGAENEDVEFTLDELEDVTPKQYLNVYMHDRSYGGGEEGGWWYDTYDPVTEPGDFRCRLTYPDGEDATTALNLLRGVLEEENATRTSPSSVCSEGHYVCRLEAWPAVGSPARKPHYC